MRPTTSTMLQQNNNNNYPCLNMAGSTREMLQKCSRASLPFPSRLELGLGDLPLIRGLRAWALCSKNRRRAGILGGGLAPVAPPTGRGSSTSCPRPADVYLSGQWGRTGYGLPLGLDARQAGIGALVTVATLKTSEGSGKTQTQCLFLRTEKGSCLYSTAKPSSGVTTSAASSMVGEWLRGKTGGGGAGRDTPARRRDSVPAPPAQTGTNQVRVRSGRRWRKSGKAAGWERAGVGSGRQQRSWEDPAGEFAAEEKQEEQDKGGPDRKLQDSRRVKCCHNVSPKNCNHCGRRSHRRESQDQSQSPGRGVPNRLRKERRKNEEDEEEKGGLCNSHLADLECYGESRSCDVNGETKRNEGLRRQISPSQDDRAEMDEDTNRAAMKKHGDSKDSMVIGDFKSTHNHGVNDENLELEPCEEGTAGANSFSDNVETNQESEKEMEFTSISKAGSVTRTDTSFVPVEDGLETFCVRTAHESDQNLFQVYELGLQADLGFIGKEELDVSEFQPQEANFAADENNTVTEHLNKNGEPRFVFENEENSKMEEKIVLSSPLRQRIAHASESEKRVVNQEEEEIRTCNKLDGEKWDALEKEGFTEVKRNCASKDDWRFQSQESEDGWIKEDGDTSGQATSTGVESNGESSVKNIACADPPTSVAAHQANPTPSLPLLAPMATSLPCVKGEEEKEEEEEEVVVSGAAGDGGDQKEKRGHRREPEEQTDVESGFNVATEDTRKEEEEEEEDEFGVFMQAEGEPAWSEGVNMSASVPCGSRESIALGNPIVTGESTHCRPGWTDGSFDQSDNSWTAFPQDDAGRDVEQWWPTSAVEARRDGLSTNHSLASVFAEAFPSLPDPSSSDSCDLVAVPTLTQLLRGRTSQDQGLLDGFHDLNKMIGQRYKRANGVSRDLLLRTLHLEQPHTANRPASLATNRRLSPGLTSTNQHAQSAATKRRLSYDCNRNIME
ncbi:uncharacterized protein PAE49_010162 [Odontesthes bonariensis]|uniref:uncharacterized protein LOC142388119 n=1 Tax=Odontesthes bonariensis TaxID=219752 RepID=UPI003F58AA8D